MSVAGMTSIATLEEQAALDTSDVPYVGARELALALKILSAGNLLLPTVTLSDEDLRELGYQAEGSGSGARAEDVEDEVHPHQDELLDEGVEETFPASDPVSVKRIT